MSTKQNDTGRAFEFGLAVEFSTYLPAELQNSIYLQKARECFDACTEKEQTKIKKSAHEIVGFLVGQDNRLTEKGCSIYLQADIAGQHGDVRDIIIKNANLNVEIGISAKNRHFALKHSRLSETINFGTDWLGVSCSSSYFDTITPIFQELRARKQLGEKWSEIDNKQQLYYIPILQAFEDEMKSLFAKDPAILAKALIHYLLGRIDYYKVIKENGDVSVISININGSLLWGGKLPMPTRIIEISHKPETKTTLIMTLDNGWAISFRIHNASTMVEPSLKFDIKLAGIPPTTSRFETPYLSNMII